MNPVLKGLYLLQTHVLPKHADNFQHYPDDNLSMLPFCLFLFTDEKLQLVKWASWPPTTVKSVCVCVCVCVCVYVCVCVCVCVCVKRC